MMVVMGLGTGAMMACAHSMADASCIMHGDHPEGADAGCEVVGEAGFDVGFAMGF